MTMAHKKIGDFISEIQEEIKLLEAKGTGCLERARKIETLKGYVTNLKEYRNTPFHS
jgi:hypothetical protein